jgi:hypothetical protein
VGFLFFMKKCSICKETKSLDFYYFNKSNKGNYFNYCKECHKEKTIKKEKEKVLLKNEKINFLNDEFFIENFETGLLVSNFGRVFSPYRETGNKRYAHFLKQTKMSNGYLSISFNKKHIYVHRLVADSMIPNLENKTHVNHIDCDKLNNNLYNLEWCTHLDNIYHGVKNDAYKVKLDREKVFKIRNSKKTVNELSIEYDVSKTNIRLVLNRKIWKHI